MSPPSSSAPLFRWYRLTERERLVWASSFATFAGSAADAAYAADANVLAMKSLALDEGQMAPEQELAKANLVVSYEDFVPWYRVAHRMVYRRDRSYKPPTDTNVAEAYAVYQRSRRDVY